jgi:hypothetical protein
VARQGEDRYRAGNLKRKKQNKNQNFHFAVK